MKNCRLCGGELEVVLALPALPPVDNFRPTKTEVSLTPCDLYICKACAHVQLKDIIDPDLLYRDYHFHTGDVPALVEHFKLYAEDCQRFCTRLVVEIGSNDGTLLKFFRERGSSVIGVDPNNVKKMVPTLPEFFTESLAKDMRAQYGGADLICANHVFAHMDDIADVVRGVKALLSDTGVFVFEAMYLHDLIEKNYIDTIFHEHLSYHSIEALVPFFDRHGLELFEVQHNDCKGGSIRGFVQHKDGPFKVRLPYEAHVTPESFDAMRDTLTRWRTQVAGLTYAIGYGASASATAMMYHLGLQDRIHTLVDDNPRRRGMYSPGANIPVSAPESLYEDQFGTPSEPIVILAPRYNDAIIARHPLLAKRFVAFK